MASYHDISAGGESRQHNGNSYNYHTNVYPTQQRVDDSNISRNETRNNALIKAAAEGQTRRVQKLIYDGADVDFKNAQGVTALHEAAYAGFEDTVKTLLDAGADINASHNTYGTPLILAALRGRVNVVRILLDGRASADMHTGVLGSALHAACAGNDPNTVAMILQASKAVRTRDQAHIHGVILQFMLRPAAKFQCDTLSQLMGGTDLLETKSTQRTPLDPLQVSALCGATDVISVLLDAGSSVDTHTELRHMDLLMIAAVYGHAAWLERFLKLLPGQCAIIGTNWDSKGYNVLMGAAHRGHRDCLDCLLRHNPTSIDAKTTNEHHETAVYISCKQGHEGCLDVLIKHGADIDVRSEVSGMSSIMIAARCGHHACVDRLLEAGASLEMSSVRSYLPARSVLHYAAMGGHSAMVETLLKAGMEVDGTDSNGRTALWYAIEEGSKSAVVCLLEAGASMHVGDSAGNAYRMAQETGNQEVEFAIRQETLRREVSGKSPS